LGEGKAVPSSQPSPVLKPGEGGARKSKEQKRLEAEQHQARFRHEQELQRKEEVRKRLKESEGLILNELGKTATHQNPARVKDLSHRLGEIQKQIKTLD